MVIKIIFSRIGEDELVDSNEAIENSKSMFNQAYETFPDEKSTKTGPIKKDEEFENFGLWTGSKQEDLVHGIPFILQQFRALFMKRFIYSIRNKTLVVSQLVIPLCTLLINMIYLKYAPIKPEDSPALQMDISKYGDNFAPYLLTGQKNSDFIQKYASIYKSQLKGFKNTKVFDLESESVLDSCNSSRSSIDSYLTCLGEVDFNYVIDKTVLSATFDSTLENVTLIGHFNNQPFHVPPLSLNLITNSLLKLYSKSNESAITIINHPLPRNLTEIITDQLNKDMTSFNVASGLTFGFSFLIASFAIILIKEKNSNAKHLQYMSGCNSYIFWISALIWDMINYMIPTIFVFVILKVFEFFFFG